MVQRCLQATVYYTVLCSFVFFMRHILLVNANIREGNLNTSQSKCKTVVTWLQVHFASSFSTSLKVPHFLLRKVPFSLIFTQIFTCKQFESPSVVRKKVFSKSLQDYYLWLLLLCLLHHRQLQKNLPVALRKHGILMVYHKAIPHIRLEHKVKN